MTAKCSVQRRNRRRLSGRARPLVGLALVAFALLGAPAPGVAGQPAPRPEPTELWRQFPLDAEPSEPVGRAEAGPMSSAPTPTTDSTPAAEERSLSLSMVQIAAIVAATALVLLLLAGALAYSASGSLAFAIRRRERRLARPFRDFVDARRTDASDGRPVGTVTAAFRPAKRRAEATLHAVRVAAVDACARIGSEVGRLKRQSSVRIMPSNERPTAIEGVGTLGDRIEDYIPGGESKTGTNAAREVPKLEPDRHRAPPSSLADDELEILKAKLGKPTAPAGDERINEAETLKAKLRDDAARKKGATTAPNLLKRKLAERRAPEKAVARAAADAASSSGKPEPTETPGNEVATSSGLGTRGAASAVRQEERAARRTPLPPNGPAATSRRAEAAGPLGLVPSPSRTSDRPVLEEPLQPEEPLGIKCRILWWRGYIGSMFYALARTPGGQEYVIAESPHFRWSKSHAPPKDPPAAEAHRSLVEALEREGWSVAGTGEHWFMLELERRQARRRPGSRGGQTG
jgi:hypothetical protein